MNNLNLSNNKDEIECENASNKSGIDEENKDNEEIDELQELNYYLITNSFKSFTSLLDSINYDKDNNFNLLSHLSTKDSEGDNDLYETLILLINKGREAIQEGKDTKSHIN